MGVCQERRPAHLHHHPADRPPLGGDVVGDGPRQACGLAPHLVPVLQVPLERRLPAARAGDVRRAEHARARQAAAEGDQPGAGGRSELGGEPPRVGRGELADRPDAQTREPLRGLRADAPECIGPAVAEDGEPVLLGEPVHARRLAESGGELRLQPVVPDADRAVEPGGVAHPALDRAGHGLGVVALDGEEGLVPAEYLDDRVEAPQHRHHPLGRLLVGLAVDGQEHRVGASACRRAQRQAGLHAELPRLVRRGAHHTALGRVAVAADDHGPTAQFGVAQHLDRRDELVEVHVQHPSGHN